MYAARHLGVAFPKFHGEFGVAFYAEAAKTLHAGVLEHLARDLEHEGVLVEGGALRRGGLRQAKVAVFLDIHAVKIDIKK
jgi:hypothetical protein